MNNTIKNSHMTWIPETTRYTLIIQIGLFPKLMLIQVGLGNLIIPNKLIEQFR